MLYNPDRTARMFYRQKEQVTGQWITWFKQHGDEPVKAHPQDASLPDPAETKVQKLWAFLTGSKYATLIQVRSLDQDKKLTQLYGLDS